MLDDLSAGHRAAVPAGVTARAWATSPTAARSRGPRGRGHRHPLRGRPERGRVGGPAAQVLADQPAEGRGPARGHGRGRGVAGIIFSSTCATYGVPRAVPIDESHPQEPINPYGAEQAGLRARASRPRAAAGVLRAVALRYFNAAGCHPDGSLGEDHDPEIHLIPLAIDAALGRRPAAHGLRRRLRHPRRHLHPRLHPRAGPGPGPRAGALARWRAASAYRFYNLGTETGHSVREVIAAVEQVAGTKVPAHGRPAPAGRSAAARGLGREDPRRAGLPAPTRRPRGHRGDRPALAARPPAGLRGGGVTPPARAGARRSPTRCCRW